MGQENSITSGLPSLLPSSIPGSRWSPIHRQTPSRLLGLFDEKICPPKGQTSLFTGFLRVSPRDFRGCPARQVREKINIQVGGNFPIVYVRN